MILRSWLDNDSINNITYGQNSQGVGMSHQDTSSKSKKDSAQAQRGFTKLTASVAELEQPYEDAFDFVFSNDDIRNIAITGGYGSGKSSLMAAVQLHYSEACDRQKTSDLQVDDHSPEDDVPSTCAEHAKKTVRGASCCIDSGALKGHRFLTISLTRFDSETSGNRPSDGEDAEGNRAERTEEPTRDDRSPLDEVGAKADSGRKTHGPTVTLEGKIINQIIHRVSPKVLSRTRFRKTHRPSVAPVVLVSVYLVFTVLYFLSLGNVLTPSLSTFMADTRSFFTIAWAAYSIGIATFLIHKGAIRKFVKRVGFQGSEVEFFNADGDSFFDRYMDDIVYMLNESRYDVVIFEDIDRFENAEIFVRLREINELANAARRRPQRSSFFKLCCCLKARFEGHPFEGAVNSQPLRFFYLVRDDLLASRDRTKFFDFIIPVIPYLDYSNSYSVLHDSFPNLEQSPEEECQRDISLYLDDARLLHNIVNEFLIYSERLSLNTAKLTRANYSKLFSLITYKNLFPSDFARLQFDEGYLFGLIASRKELRCEMKHAAEKTQAQILKQIDTCRNDIRENEVLKALQQDAELHECARSYGVANGLTEADSLSSLIEWAPNVSEKLHHVMQQRKESYWNSQSIEERINEQLAAKCPDQLVRKKRCESLLQDISQAGLGALLALSQNEEISYDLDCFFEPKDSQQKKDMEKNGEKGVRLVRMMLINGYIDSSFRNYMSLFREGSLTSRDHEYLMMVSAGNKVDANREMDDPTLLVSSMDRSLFARPGSRVLQLVEALFSLDNPAHNEKQEVFLGSLSGKKDARFICDLANSDCFQSSMLILLDEALLPNLVFANKSYVRREGLTAFVTRQYLASREYGDPYFNAVWEKTNGIAATNGSFLSFSFDWLSQEGVADVMSAIREMNEVGIHQLIFSAIDFDAANPEALSFVYRAKYFHATADILKGMLKTQHGVVVREDPIALLQAVCKQDTEPVKVVAGQEVDSMLSELMDGADGWILEDDGVIAWILGNSRLSIDSAARFVEHLPLLSVQFADSYPRKLASILLDGDVLAPSPSNILHAYAATGEIGGKLGNLFALLKPGDTPVSLTAVLTAEESEGFLQELIESPYVDSASFDAFTCCAECSYDAIDFEEAYPSKIEVAVRKKLLAFTPGNYDGVKQVSFELSLLFALDHFELFCQHIAAGELIADERTVDAMYKNTSLDPEQCGFLFNHASPLPRLSREYSDTANSVILEYDLIEDEIESLSSLWEQGSERLRRSIEAKYLDLASSGTDLGDSVPREIIDSIVSADSVAIEYKLQLLIANMPRMSVEQIQSCFALLGMTDFAAVIGGCSKKRKVRSNNYVNGNAEVAERLKECGHLSAWWRDKQNNQDIWIMRANGKQSRNSSQGKGKRPLLPRA